MRNVTRVLVWLVPLVLIGDVCQADVTLGPWHTGVVSMDETSESSLDALEAADFEVHIAFYKAFNDAGKDHWQNSALIDQRAFADSFQSPAEPGFGDGIEDVVDVESTDGLDLENEEAVSVAAIPEPSVAIVVGLGLMSIVCLRRRRVA